MFNMKIGSSSKPQKQIPSSPAIKSGQPQAEVITPEVLDQPLNTSSPEPDAATHFDDLINEEGAEDFSAAPRGPSGGFISKEDFHKVFVTGFVGAHHLTKLQSLKVNPDDGAAIDASSAIYDSIMDIPALHGMLKTDGKWWGRILAIGVFTVPLASNIGAEMAARKAPRQQPQSAQPEQKAAAPAQPVSPGEPDELARAALTGA